MVNNVQASVLSGEGTSYAAGGTPSFMAPELFQVSGSNPDGIDLHKTDIWSLGVTLYFMVMGRTPWQVGNEIELAHCVQNMVIQFPDEKVDPHLKFLLRQMLERNFNKRIDLNGVLTDDWVTQEGTDPLLSEQEVIDEETRPHTGHVLLVESSPSSRNHVSLKLDQANCTHMIAQTLADGLECVTTNMKPSQFAVAKFGCVLVAEELSDGTALELLAKLREAGYTGFVVALMDVASSNNPLSPNSFTKDFLSSKGGDVSGNSSSNENLLRTESFRAVWCKAGGTTVWSKNIHTIDVIELFAKHMLELGSSTDANEHAHGHGSTGTGVEKNDHGDDEVVLSVKELKEAIVHIPPRPDIKGTVSCFFTCADSISSEL
jgi:serine/threonine protein kinase